MTLKLVTILGIHHHHHAVDRDAIKTVSIHLTIALHLSLCCESDVHESVFVSLA